MFFLIFISKNPQLPYFLPVYFKDILKDFFSFQKTQSHLPCFKKSNVGGHLSMLWCCLLKYLLHKKRSMRLVHRREGCYVTKNDPWGCCIPVEAATTKKTIREAAVSLRRLLRHKKRSLRLLRCGGGCYDTKNNP